MGFAGAIELAQMRRLICAASTHPTKVLKPTLRGAPSSTSSRSGSVPPSQAAVGGC